MLETNSKKKDYKTLIENPAFTKLTEEKKKDLIFIHKNLRDADARVFNNKLKLTNYFKNDSENNDEDLENGKAAYIYNLPRRRMTIHESSSSLKSTVKNTISKAKDLFRQSADDEEARFGEEDLDDDADKDTGTSTFNGAIS